jgi:hypothetical protein
LQLFDPASLTFEDNLWRGAQDLTREGLFRLAQTHSVEPYFGLELLLRHCESSPLAVIERYLDFFPGAEIRSSEKMDGAGVVWLAAKNGESAVLACLPSSHPNIWLLARRALPGDSEKAKALDHVLDRLSSRIHRGWLSSHELERALVHFEEESQMCLSPSRVASRGFDRSTVEYLRVASLQQVISELREKRLLLQSLAFKLRPADSKGVILSSAVDRWLRVVYRQGNASLLNTSFLRMLEDLLSAHFVQVAVREPGISKGEIVYKFEQNELMTSESHDRLVKALAGITQLSVCAFHSNPYLNLSVTDLSDGSSMALISDAADRMYVTPSQRCSPGAVSRVLNSVYTAFAAGRVLTDGEQDEWSRIYGSGA